MSETQTFVSRTGIH